MNIDFNQRVEQEVGNAIRKAVADLLTSYNSPLIPIVTTAVKNRGAEIAKCFESSIMAALNDPSFQEQINEEMRGRLVKMMVSKFDGGLESELNRLKSDPVMRAKITLAMSNMAASLGIKV